MALLKEEPWAFQSLLLFWPVKVCFTRLPPIPAGLPTIYSNVKYHVRVLQSLFRPISYSMHSCGIIESYQSHFTGKRGLALNMLK